MSKIYDYNLNLFNNSILRIIENELNANNFYNFEAMFSKCIRGGKENKPYEKYINKYYEIIEKILKSSAAENYFNETYKSKCKGLSYHFNRDSVIKEIFNRIKFFTIFEPGDQAYTSPMELKIYINCIKGSYNDYHIHPFEREILQFTKLILITIQEIMGHFLRRYYSFLTNGLLKFETKEDEKFVTNESGNFGESVFLGLSNNRTLSLNESLGFFKSDFDKYPILYKGHISDNDLILIIKNNEELFDFISEENSLDKLTIEELGYYLNKGYKEKPRIICGNNSENAIFIEEPYY